MKVMWITNQVLPFPSKYFNLKVSNYGGWLNSSLEELKDDANLELCVISFYKGKRELKCIEGNIEYIILPHNIHSLNYSKLNGFAIKIISEFSPDIIHLHGTEFPHSLAFIKNKKNAKVIASIQGLVSKIGENYLLGLNVTDILRTITIRDLLKRDNLFQQRRKFIKRGKYEKVIISLCDAVIGRTEWDYSVSKSLNNEIKYYINNETLRPSFYNRKWDIDCIEDYSIYVSQASYPIKGFHILLKALPIVIERFPNTKVYVAGSCVTANSTLFEKLKISGYGKLLNRMIKEYKLSNNVIFTGELSEQETTDRLLKSNLFVLSSILENSSNSLGEAMLMGVPFIASFTGGTPTICEHSQQSQFYEVLSFESLANKIINIFNDKDKQEFLSKNSKNTAYNRYDSKVNKKILVDIYKNLEEE